MRQSFAAASAASYPPVWPFGERPRIANENLNMIEDARGAIDYEEWGTGPTLVLVPGSCSTGAAWRPVIAALDNQFRCVTTSLLGYGGTAERRSASDPSIAHEADMLESVVRRAGSAVHLVGHSFGGLVALAAALRHRVSLASLTIIEPPAIELLRERAEREHYSAFGRMTEAYVADFANGNAEAIAAMIDFYGGAGTFASWPPRVRAYAAATTAVNILDWASAYGFPLPATALAAVEIPVLIVCGGASHPAMQRICALLGAGMNRASLATVNGAAHFMIATHANEVGRLLARHVHRAAAPRIMRPKIAAAMRRDKDVLKDTGTGG
jgi:pimeloyl-ACP methyl ester carboxylesterase